MHVEARANTAYELRLKEARRILGKDELEIKRDEETGEEILVAKRPARKTISKEDAQALEYRAIVAEGKTLYHAKEYRRAIEAFTTALEKQKEGQSVLIDRANCYIQVGQPDDALRDVDLVLRDHPESPQAILTKAEAYFSMGEFEFALVFFQRGQSIRKDIVAFRDGVTKCKSAILDSINGSELYQANPNFAVSRPRKPLVEISPEKTQPRQDDPEKLRKTAELLPEKVEPLPITLGCKEFLGELSLDYEYLLEVQEEIGSLGEEGSGKAEDEKILEVVCDALTYLDQRSAFWSQQDGSGAPDTERGREPSPDVRAKKSVRRSAASPDAKAKKSVSRVGLATSPQKKRKAAKAARYEMSKIQQYETKYGGSPEQGARRSSSQNAPGVDE
jgi:tetratricopeptide (TPR) repeat protein